MRRKLKTWTYLVRETGWEQVRKIPLFNDEPLVGRHRSVRSVRLSSSYRTMSRLVQENDIVFVSIEEASNHGY